MVIPGRRAAQPRATDAVKPCRTCRLDGIQGSLLGAYPELRFAESWKFGQRYRCSACARSWFVHLDGRRATRIRDDLLELAEHWNRTHLAVGPALVAQLATIGGVIDHHRDRIAIPGSVRLVGGERLARAVVLVTREPPCFWYRPEQVRWADEIEAVEASDEALPVDVRRACEVKTEESFGYAPVDVVDARGNAFTLVSSSPFFDQGGVLGKDIRLSDRRRHRGPKVSPQAAHAYVFVDWFDGCEAALLPQPAG